jgi:hypothetical protein
VKIFFDTEFTGLHQKTTLISIGAVSEDGRTFYAEFSDYDRDQMDAWLYKNVYAHLEFNLVDRATPDVPNYANFEMKGRSLDIAAKLTTWLAQWDRVEMWSDCYAYDWVLLCELFGGAFNIPSNVYYIPFDLSTAFVLRGVDPDVSRDEYAGLPGDRKHNALHDAMAIKACYERLTAL